MPKQKLFVFVAVLTAVVAAFASRLPAGPHTQIWSAESFKSQRVASALPQGFVLPSADGNVNVSSLVAADLDADGDLDIVASDGASGSVEILVWENDGAGRLTRRQPDQKRSLGSAPASPALEQHASDAPDSIPPDSPAMQTITASTGLTPPARSFDRPRAPGATSAALDVLRSRAPPARS